MKKLSLSTKLQIKFDLSYLHTIILISLILKDVLILNTMHLNLKIAQVSK